MNLLVLANNTALTRAKHVEVINPEDNLLTLTPVSFAVAAGLFGVFVLVRVVHSVCYASSLGVLPSSASAPSLSWACWDTWAPPW